MRSTMKMTGLTLLALIGLGATSEAGPITYDIADYSALQSGWSLSGTITTDGNIGALSVGDITSYSFTITNGTTTLTQSSSDPNSAVVLNGTVLASSTAITIPAPGFRSFSDFEIGNGIDGEDLSYGRYNHADGAFYDEYQEIDYSQGPASQSWDAVSLHSNTLSLGAVDPWTIATVSAVPEPSSLVLAGIAVIGGTVVAVRRRRK
jgi:hypothetical protein